MWAQTPQFSVQLSFPDDLDINMDVHHGVIKSFEIDAGHESETHEELRSVLVGQKLQDIHSWTALLQPRIKNWSARCSSIADRLDEMMPIPPFPAR
jgi:lipoate-protein ligase A